MISCIVCTYDRQGLLPKAIAAIVKNTIIPDEIVVVEQGDIEKTKSVLKDFPVTVLFYPEKSAAQARNFGLKHSLGDIVFFIDDDLEVNTDYIEVAMCFFNEHPQVKIVSGVDTNACIPKKNIVKRCIRSVLYQDTFSDKRIVLKNGQNTVRIHFSKPVTSQWASGTMAIKRDITDNILFRNNFLRWSFGEDVDFSYQVYKNYGEGSIYFLPDMRFSHIKSEIHRISNDAGIRMVFLYRYIFWKQEVYEGRWLHGFLYIYSEVFRAVLYAKSYDNFFSTYKKILQTQLYIIKNYKKIDMEHIDYNSYIFSEK